MTSVASVIEQFKNGGMDIQSLMHSVASIPSRPSHFESSSEDETTPSNKKRKLQTDDDDDECPEFLNFTKLQRMQRNRESAARSRTRKREHLDQLENTVALLQAQLAQVSALQTRVESLETENATLRQELRVYQQREQIATLSSIPTSQIISQPALVSPENSPTQFENVVLPTDSFQFNPLQDFFELSSADTNHLSPEIMVIKEDVASNSNIPSEHNFFNESSNCAAFAGVPDVKYATLGYSLQSRSGNILCSLVLLYHLLMMVQVWTFLSGQVFGVFLANLYDQRKNRSSSHNAKMSNSHSFLLSNGSQTSRLPLLLPLPPVRTKNGRVHPSSIHSFLSLTNPSADTFVKRGPP